VCTSTMGLPARPAKVAWHLRDPVHTMVCRHGQQKLFGICEIKCAQLLLPQPSTSEDNRLTARLQRQSAYVNSHLQALYDLRCTVLRWPCSGRMESGGSGLQSDCNRCFFCNCCPDISAEISQAVVLWHGSPATCAFSRPLSLWACLFLHYFSSCTAAVIACLFTLKRAPCIVGPWYQRSMQTQ